MRSLHFFALAAGFSVLCFSPNLLAEDKPKDQELMFPKGAAFTVGGGVTGFADTDTRDFADNTGGTWQARLVLGTRLPVSVEAAYIGTATGINALGLDRKAVLMANGVEGLARVNILPATFTVRPYLLGGVAWKHYSLANVDTNTSAVNDTDDTFEIPVGMGASYQFGRLVLDARGTFSSSYSNDLIAVPGGAEVAGLDNWTASVNLGWEL